MKYFLVSLSLPGDRSHTSPSSSLPQTPRGKQRVGLSDRTRSASYLSSTDRTGVLHIRVSGSHDDGRVGHHLGPLGSRLLLVADATVEILIWSNIDNERVNVAGTLSTGETLLVINLHNHRNKWQVKSCQCHNRYI